jgi:hypothetical protein
MAWYGDMEISFYDDASAQDYAGMARHFVRAAAGSKLVER